MTSRLLVDKIEGKSTASTVQMPEGAVIQYKFATSNTKVTVAANAYGNTGTSIAFTPKFSNSIIQIYWEGMLVKDASGAGSVAFGIFQDDVLMHGIPADGDTNPYILVKDETRIYARPSYTFSHVAGSTSARTYRCKFRGYNNTQTWVCNWDNPSGNTKSEEILIVQEVAQ